LTIWFALSAGRLTLFPFYFLARTFTFCTTGAGRTPITIPAPIPVLTLAAPTAPVPTSVFRRLGHWLLFFLLFTEYAAKQTF
jgi:hypothetical protein